MDRSHETNLATNLRDRRLAEGNLSQYKLAKAAGVSRSSIASIEGGHMPSLRILQRLADALKTTPEALLGKKARSRRSAERPAAAA